MTIALNNNIPLCPINCYKLYPRRPLKWRCADYWVNSDEDEASSREEEIFYLSRVFGYKPQVEAYIDIEDSCSPCASVNKE